MLLLQTQNRTELCHSKFYPCRSNFPRFSSHRTITVRPDSPNIDKDANQNAKTFQQAKTLIRSADPPRILLDFNLYLDTSNCRITRKLFVFFSKPGTPIVLARRNDIGRAFH